MSPGRVDEGGYVVNSTNEPILFTMTDTAGATYCVFDMQPNDTKAIPVGPGCGMVGLKWGGGVAGLRAHLWGNQ